MSGDTIIPSMWDWDARGLYYTRPPMPDGEEHDTCDDTFIVGYRKDNHAAELVRLHLKDSIVQQRALSRDMCFDYPGASFETAREWIEESMFFNSMVETSSGSAAVNGLDLLRVLHPCKEAIVQVSSMMPAWESEE